MQKCSTEFCSERIMPEKSLLYGGTQLGEGEKCRALSWLSPLTLYVTDYMIELCMIQESESPALTDY